MQRENLWKIKLQLFFRFLKKELIRTLSIGHKMVSASRTNTQLYDLYHELGDVTFQAIKTGELKWENPKALEILKDIERYQSDLTIMEFELQELKKSNMKKNR